MKIIEGFETAKAALLRQREAALPGADDRELVVRDIVEKVRERGDAVLFDFTAEFDGVRLEKLEVDRGLIDGAYAAVDKKLLAALELAAGRITAFHERQKQALLRDSTGESLGWLVRPLRSVGVHAPGFTAPLPSSVLMAAIPARVAGVEEIILVTPPGRGVAALAYGTESVPRVDKVCGPGNIYVSLAKRFVFGAVGIDGLYGPSEVVIVADDSARPAYCAADLLAQAEHGSGASAILITDSQALAGAVSREIKEQLRSLQRRDVIEASLESRGLIAVVGSVQEAIDLADLYAPEHVCLVVKDAPARVGSVHNAGCIFIGESSLEVIVDYVAGPSHVLPTEGTARFSSGLNVLDFIRIISTVETGNDEIQSLGGAASVIARAEGLDAHARAVETRLEDMERETDDDRP
jgi:histidinol dehydrogenase